MIAAFILLFGTLSAGDWSYYRRDGSRRTLVPCESLITVKFAAVTPSLQPTDLLKSGFLSQDHGLSEIGMGFWLYHLAEGIELDSAIAGLSEDPEIAFVNPVFVEAYSRFMFAGDQVILKTRDLAGSPPAAPAEGGEQAKSPHMI